MTRSKSGAPMRNRAGHVYVSVLEVPGTGGQPAQRWQAVTVPASSTPGGPYRGATPREALGELLSALGESTWVPHGQRTALVLRTPWKGLGADPGGRPARASDGAAASSLTVRLSEGERERVRRYAAAAGGLTEAAVVRQGLTALGILT